MAKSHNEPPSFAAISENFNHHFRKWEEIESAQALLDRRRKDAKGMLKADGHTVEQMKIAVDLKASPKREAKVVGRVETILLVARYRKHPMGDQYDLFAGAIQERKQSAYNDGYSASENDKPCKPPFDPETPQYQQFMAGYGAHQAKLAGGFKKLEDDEADDGPGNGWGEDDDDPGKPLEAA